MRTDTLKKESHIAFRHPISSFTPYSERQREVASLEGGGRVAMILVGFMPEGYSWVWGMPWTYHGGF